eukprot:4212862-Prymnesium_polylepis.1
MSGGCVAVRMLGTLAVHSTARRSGGGRCVGVRARVSGARAHLPPNSPRTMGVCVSSLAKAKCSSHTPGMLLGKYWSSK